MTRYKIRLKTDAQISRLKWVCSYFDINSRTHEKSMSTYISFSSFLHFRNCLVPECRWQDTFFLAGPNFSNDYDRCYSELVFET